MQPSTTVPFALATIAWPPLSWTETTRPLTVAPSAPSAMTALPAAFVLLPETTTVPGTALTTTFFLVIVSGSSR